MYFESTKNCILELTELKYDVNEWLYLWDKYNLEMYIDKTGKPFGLEVCYDIGLLDEPVIKNVITMFKDFGLKLDYKQTPGSGHRGFQLAKSKLENGLFIHRDGYRPCCLTYPVSFPATVDFYSNKQGDDMWSYDYTNVPVLINVQQWHGVRPSNEERKQFQLDIYTPWEDIPSLIEKI